ncbi:hypothetical protein [Streptomyces sp. CC210A]|uniref:hypothetical protein n=1 Tax=Streptomyces sp. CC210A TaxID=2898184 RepID=UPI001F29A1DD|nr:hypothetical protein [Streptomyces sp. CC210A]
MTQQTPTPEDDSAKPGEGEQPQGEPQSAAPQGPSEDELPEWARKELTKVRGEAASYRTRLRDAETRLGQAKTPEEVEAALAEVRAKNTELERELRVSAVARKHGLPDELTNRLRGESVDELEADAKALSALLRLAPPENLSGGLDPNDGDDGELDPRKLARLTTR